MEGDAQCCTNNPLTVALVVNRLLQLPIEDADLCGNSCQPQRKLDRPPSKGELGLFSGKDATFTLKVNILCFGLFLFQVSQPHGNTVKYFIL